ncbi:MAG: hypothetical protein OXE17_03975 [Chloroflexi bacterium]|nr:hypothetical protein [Chloroflexota bacterium]
MPISNGVYSIIMGEGYIDVPIIEEPIIDYNSQFPFELETSQIGDSEMQHLDRAYAMSLIRHFAEDESLVLTIRGRKYSPEFDFVTGEFQIHVDGVQTEVDAGYEGVEQVVLIEAKGGEATNTIIRQMYYPFRQWQYHTDKEVSTLFFQRDRDGIYNLWQFSFANPDDYNSIHLLRSGRYRILLGED